MQSDFWAKLRIWARRIATFLVLASVLGCVGHFVVIPLTDRISEGTASLIAFGFCAVVVGLPMRKLFHSK